MEEQKAALFLVSGKNIAFGQFLSLYIACDKITLQKQASLNSCLIPVDMTTGKLWNGLTLKYYATCLLSLGSHGPSVLCVINLHIKWGPFLHTTPKLGLPRALEHISSVTKIMIPEVFSVIMEKKHGKKYTHAKLSDSRGHSVVHLIQPIKANYTVLMTAALPTITTQFECSSHKTKSKNKMFVVRRFRVCPLMLAQTRQPMREGTQCRGAGRWVPPAFSMPPLFRFGLAVPYNARKDAGKPSSVTELLVLCFMTVSWGAGH